MAVDIRIHFCDAERVAILRFIGMIDGATMFAAVRDSVRNDPHRSNYAAIFDIRRWAGMVFDTEVREQINWMKKLRRVELAEDHEPPLICLTNDAAAMAPLLDAISAVRGRAVKSATTPEEAWHLAAPSHRLPKDVAKFLKKK